VWWSWIGFTFYADRFETEEAAYRVLMFAGMLGVIGLSLTLGSAFSPQGDLPFVVCCAFVRLVLALLYVRAAYYVPLARSYSIPFVAGLAGSSCILLGSLLVDPPYRYVMWALAFALELATPFLNLKATRAVPIDRSHIPERLGLFTIIVLGEAVVAVANSASQIGWSAPIIAASCMGFAMAACIWWINFEFVEDSAVRSRSLLPRFIYLYGHFVMLASIVAIGIGVEHAIKETVEPHLHFASLALMAGGAAVYLTVITIIRLITGVCNLVYSRFVAIAAMLVIMLTGGLLPPLAVFAAVLAVMAVNVWLEAFYAEEHEADETPFLEPCDHAPDMQVFEARTHHGCEECVKSNYKWVHLRLCLVCGHVGCCDTSVYKHATKHFHNTDHTLIASLEAGENWAWCYVDNRFVPLPRPVEN